MPIKRIKKNSLKTKEKKTQLMSLTSQIVFAFVILSTVFLMAGFIVQAQIMCKQANFWQKVATYYYQEASK